MRLYKLSLLIIPVIFLSACGGGHDDSHDYYHDTYYEEIYINWAGSVNGTIVVDATDDAFEFEVITGYMHFGNTTYTNAWVDAYGDFYVDGLHIGAVFYVKSIENETIAALISNNGYYIDFYGPESNLAWTEADTIPIYAFNSVATSDKQLVESIYTQTARQTETKTSAEVTAPETNMNAYTEDLPTNNQSTLGN